jgi:hypothetical protein
VAGIGHSQSMRAQPYFLYKLSNRLLSRSRSVGSERVNLGGSAGSEQRQRQVRRRVKDPDVMSESARMRNESRFFPFS